jgi:calcineurin-like phosphoesterase family protein
VKAKIVSDQHLEFRASGNSWRKYFDAIHPNHSDDADVCIVAGDFDVVARESNAYFQELCNREQRVLFVPGNHEYYGCRNMAAVDETLQQLEARIRNLTVLRTGEVFEFSGRRFLGDTMWVPKFPELILTANLMNDSQYIPRLLEEVGERHQKFLKWLSGEMRAGDIVVTHHLPSARSTPEEHRNSAVQPWFVASDSEVLFAKEPAAWIHGHTHARCDYVLHKTRVLCNPVGYPHEIGKLPGRLMPLTFEL